MQVLVCFCLIIDYVRHLVRSNSTRWNPEKLYISNDICDRAEQLWWTSFGWLNVYLHSFQLGSKWAKISVSDCWKLPFIMKLSKHHEFLKSVTDIQGRQTSGCQWCTAPRLFCLALKVQGICNCLGQKSRFLGPKKPRNFPPCCATILFRPNHLCWFICSKYICSKF